ncbi:MAG: hypothetical protein IJ306_09715 [Oscillospiraceae bacterium]|nr:hypothetical protein [Oscillospiraceae bacterium]
MERVVEIVGIGNKETFQKIYDKFKEYIPNKELKKNTGLMVERLQFKRRFSSN